MVGVLYGMNVFLQQTTAVRLKYYSHFFNGTKQCFSKLEQNDKYASAYSEHKVIIHYNMQILLFIAKSSNEHRLCADRDNIQSELTEILLQTLMRNTEYRIF